MSANANKIKKKHYKKNTINFSRSSMSANANKKNIIKKIP
jgi:hypothetical protein